MQKDLSNYLKSLISLDAGIEFPAPIFKDMEGRFVEYVENKSLTVRFPIKNHYKNPFGFMQGGMIIAAIDCTIGALNFFVKRPGFTTQLNNTFIRPIDSKEKYIDIIASVVEWTKRQIHAEAIAINRAGKICVKSFASSLLVKD